MDLQQNVTEYLLATTEAYIKLTPSQQIYFEHILTINNYSYIDISLEVVTDGILKMIIFRPDIDDSFNYYFSPCIKSLNNTFGILDFIPMDEDADIDIIIDVSLNAWDIKFENGYMIIKFRASGYGNLGTFTSTTEEQIENIDRTIENNNFTIYALDKYWWLNKNKNIYIDIATILFDSPTKSEQYNSKIVCVSGVDDGVFYQLIEYCGDKYHTSLYLAPYTFDRNSKFFTKVSKYFANNLNYDSDITYRITNKEYMNTKGYYKIKMSVEFDK